MNDTVSKLDIAVLVLIAAIMLALLSVYVERTGPDLVQYGNLCGASGSDPCYRPALKGGFPVAFLVDAPGISREGQLAFVEDRLNLGALIADVGVYFAVLMLIVWRTSWRRRAARKLNDLP